MDVGLIVFAEVAKGTPPTKIIKDDLKFIRSVFLKFIKGSKILVAPLAAMSFIWMILFEVFIVGSICRYKRKQVFLHSNLRARRN